MLGTSNSKETRLPQATKGPREKAHYLSPERPVPWRRNPLMVPVTMGHPGIKVGTQKKYVSFSLSMPFIQTQVETNQSWSPGEAVLRARLPRAWSVAENRFGSWVQMENKQGMPHGVWSKRNRGMGAEGIINVGWNGEEKSEFSYTEKNWNNRHWFKRRF